MLFFIAVILLAFILNSILIAHNMWVPLLMILAISILCICLTFGGFEFLVHAKNEVMLYPVFKDPSVRAVTIAEEIPYPTSMAFLGVDDILVTENKAGKVHRILNGNLLEQPLLDVNIANYSDRCICGIAVTTNDTGEIHVFLFFTEVSSKEEEELGLRVDPLGNRLYRYELVNNKLVNPKLLLDLPSEPGAWHNGGTIRIGPDNNLYVTIGDVNADAIKGPKPIVLNHKNGTDPDGRSGILRITQDGEAVEPILGKEYPINLYYAYGIRNSFGIDFDPVSGNLWDTENGPACADEINLVEPGFNSGWSKISGFWKIIDDSCGEPASNETSLVDFDGRGGYSDPEFVWKSTVAPTAIMFLNTNKLGDEYENDLFVGDYNLRRIYHFDLSEDRKSLILEGNLADKIADTTEREELGNVLFAESPDGIIDMEVGPDGYPYILLYNRLGKIYKIVPELTNS